MKNHTDLNIIFSYFSQHLHGDQEVKVEANINNRLRADGQNHLKWNILGSFSIYFSEMKCICNQMHVFILQYLEGTKLRSVPLKTMRRRAAVYGVF